MTDRFIQLPPVSARFVAAIAAAIVVFATISVIVGQTDQIAVAPSRVTNTELPGGANAIKPAECTMTVTDQVNTTGTVTTSDNTFVTANTTSIIGNVGDDCIVAGESTTSVDGGEGTGDVCIVTNEDVAVTNCETKIVKV